MSRLCFEEVPTDCVAAALKEVLPDATYLRLGFESRSTISPSTAKTAIDGLALGGRVRCNDQIIHVPHGYRTRRIDFGGGEKVDDDHLGRCQHRLLHNGDPEHRGVGSVQGPDADPRPGSRAPSEAERRTPTISRPPLRSLLGMLECFVVDVRAREGGPRDLGRHRLRDTGKVVQSTGFAPAAASHAAR